MELDNPLDVVLSPEVSGVVSWSDASLESISSSTSKATLAEILLYKHLSDKAGDGFNPRRLTGCCWERGERRLTEIVIRRVSCQVGEMCLYLCVFQEVVLLSACHW